jgi:hypothetical protein
MKAAVFTPADGAAVEAPVTPVAETQEAVAAFAPADTQEEAQTPTEE